ncbi:MAG: galactose mutarotase [Sphaerochaetaceae bacterium]|nr:galactose mutarotase [Sphaerochaetaceae bacterium]
MITKKIHGTTPEGNTVYLYTISNQDYSVSVSTYGGALVSFSGKDAFGNMGNVLLSYGTLSEYVNSSTYLGYTIGRVANRISNGTFQLDGKTYTLQTNDHDKHTLHSGVHGFSSRIFDSEILENRLVLSLKSEDGDQGFPGEVDLSVTFSLEDDGALRIRYVGRCSERTPLNITNHAFFNLSCEKDILSHILRLDCDRYVETDGEKIPTGRVLEVRKTPFDFTLPKRIGSGLKDVGGYDHCMIRKGKTDLSKPLAVVCDPISRRKLEVFTTLEAVQFFTGNSLDGAGVSPDGIPYRKYHGFCLETQHYPDSVNNPHFPSTIYDADHPFDHTTIYKLGLC